MPNRKLSRSVWKRSVWEIGRSLCHKCYRINAYD